MTAPSEHDLEKLLTHQRVNADRPEHNKDPAKAKERLATRLGASTQHPALRLEPTNEGTQLH